MLRNNAMINLYNIYNLLISDNNVLISYRINTSPTLLVVLLIEGRGFNTLH